MRLLIANPNTNQSVTDRIAAVAREAASPGTEIRAASFGAPCIATRAEAVLSAAAVPKTITGVSIDLERFFNG